jgi:hypothetical protein
MLHQNHIILSSLAFSLAYHFTLGGIVEWAEENHETPQGSPVPVSSRTGHIQSQLTRFCVLQERLFTLKEWNSISPSPSVPLVDIPQKRNPHFNINLWRFFPWHKPTRFRFTRYFSWNGVNLSVGAYLNECFVCNALLNYIVILWGFLFGHKSGSQVRVYLIQDLHFAVIMGFDASRILFIIVKCIVYKTTFSLWLYLINAASVKCWNFPTLQRLMYLTVFYLNCRPHTIWRVCLPSKLKVVWSSYIP